LRTIALKVDVVVCVFYCVVSFGLVNMAELVADSNVHLWNNWLYLHCCEWQDQNSWASKSVGYWYISFIM